MEPVKATPAEVQGRFTQTQFDNFLWIDICNPARSDLDAIAKQYDLDYFQIKDSLEAGHLPKYEKNDDNSFLILRAFTQSFDEMSNTINDISHKIAFFYNEKGLITIHRADFDFVKNVKPKFQTSEQLMLYLINKMLNTYEAPQRILSEKNDNMEKKIFLKERINVSLEQLYYQKAQTRIIKKLLVISQNVVNHIDVQKLARPALQDVRDRLLNLVLSFEEEWENSNNLLNSYIDINAQKTNGVMKLLTVFSAFFLPLTFIAGIYGMNFKFMPELETKYGYFIVLCIMALVCIIIFAWFRRKKIL